MPTKPTSQIVAVPLPPNADHYFKVLGEFVYYFEWFIEHARRIIVETSVPGGGSQNHQLQEWIYQELINFNNLQLKNRMLNSYAQSFPSDKTGKKNIEKLVKKFLEVNTFRNKLLHSYHNINAIMFLLHDNAAVTATKAKKAVLILNTRI